MDKLTPNRKGRVTEYKEGHYYLTHTEWEDNHIEIEIHVCIPQLLWHSCDAKQLEAAKKKFVEVTKTLPLNDKTISLLPQVIEVEEEPIKE